MVVALLLVLTAGLVLLVAWRFVLADEPDEPNVEGWYCFDGPPACTPTDPCSDLCGRPVGRLQ